MGNLCNGEAQLAKINIQEDDLSLEQEDIDDMQYNTIEEPRPDVAYNINNLPPELREEKKLAQLQQTIRLMQTNQKKGKKMMKITRKYPKGESLEDPYVLRHSNWVYVGQWVFNSFVNSSIPGGLGRVYKKNEIMQGEFRSFFRDDQIQGTFAKDNISETLIRQNMKRTKFFGLQEKKVFAQSSNVVQKINVKLDGDGRIFSRQKQIRGTFKEGILHGKGAIILKEEKDTYQYEGGFYDGKKQGKGLQKYRGNVYQGDFKEDAKCGKGLLTLFITHKFKDQQQKQEQKIELDNKQRDSSKLNSLIQTFIDYKLENFDKPFQQALKDPLPWKAPSGVLQSKRFLEDSDFLLQHFRKNKFVQYYKGQFKDNRFDGYGRYVWFNGKTYDGSWKDGKMEGYGQFFWHKGGHFYQGQYKNDLKHGKGTMIWGLTKRYRGSWAFGLRHGYGQLISIESTAEKIDLKGKNQVVDKNAKEPSKITVIGALFDKDVIKHEYFHKVIQTDIKIQTLAIKFTILNAGVVGVRCDLNDPSGDKKQEQQFKPDWFQTLHIK